MGVVSVLKFNIGMSRTKEYTSKNGCVSILFFFLWIFLPESVAAPAAKPLVAKLEERLALQADTTVTDAQL